MKNQTIFLVIIFVLILLLLLCGQNIKFNKAENFFLVNPSPSEEEIDLIPFEPISPIINKIKKQENNVLVEWDNDNPEKISKFIILYKNQDNSDKATWVLRNLTSNKKNNKLILRNMFGERYHITILSVHINKDNEEKISPPGRIILFGDNNDYDALDYKKGEDINLNNRNDEYEEKNNNNNKNSNNNNNNNSNNNSNDNKNINNKNTNNNKKSNDSEGEMTEAPEETPSIKCNSEIYCQGDEEIGELKYEIRNYRPIRSLLFNL